ncbi:MAG: hypothetical protein ACRC7C_14400 [Beijerinckiaceae bacterium]
MAFDVPTIVAADNVGNDTDFDAWVKSRDLIRAANAGQLQGFKNRLINGAMDIDQRNAGAAVNLTTTGAYPVDRWSCVTTSAASGTLTAQRVATAFSTNARYCLRLARSAGSYVGGLIAAQAIETANAIDLAGRAVILSFKARKGSAYQAGLTGYIVTGTGADQSMANMVAGSWTGYTVAATAVTSLTTSWQEFSVATTLGAAVSQIGVRFDTGVFSSTGGANDYVDITDVQIEPCDVAGLDFTHYERRPINVELDLCHRYFERLTSTGGYAGMFGAGYVNTTTTARAIARRKPKRVTPTLSVSSGTHFAVISSAGNTASTAVSSLTNFAEATCLEVTVASGLTAGHGCLISDNTTASATLDFNAEL